MNISKLQISTHTSYYADKIIPHRVTTIEVEHPDWIQVNEANKLKQVKITIRVIDPLEVQEEVNPHNILEKYTVLNTYTNTLAHVINVLKSGRLGTGNIILWETLDIVRIPDHKGVYNSFNLIRDDKLLTSIITHNVSIDGDKFPKDVKPINLLLTRAYNYLTIDNRKIVTGIISSILKNMPNNPYYRLVMKDVPQNYAKAMTHFITTVIPHILEDYSDPVDQNEKRKGVLSEKLTYKNRDADTLISIMRNNLTKTREWVVLLSNIVGVARLPVIMNKSLKLVPRPIGSEDSKIFSVEIMPISGMYGDLIESLKIISTNVIRR